MSGIIFLLVLGVALGFVSSAMAKSESNKRETFPAMGKIQKVIFTDTGNAYYYVNFQANGTAYKGQSITYSSKTKTLNDGDDVRIQYYFTKAGRARVIIEDSTLIPCEASFGSYAKVLKVVSIMLVVLALILLFT